MLLLFSFLLFCLWRGGGRQELNRKRNDSTDCKGKHFAITFATWVWLANESDGCSRSKGTGKHSVSLMVFLAAFTLFHVLVFARSKSTSKPSVSLMIFLAASTVINLLFFCASPSDSPSRQQLLSELPVAADGTFWPQ